MAKALLLLLALAVSGCGSLGTLHASKSARSQIAGYRDVVVGEFSYADDAGAAKGRDIFRTRIARELAESRAFRAVRLDDGQAPALKITGRIERWRVGNVAARSLLGFVGMSEFDATVVFSDLASGAELGRLVVDRNSWPLPIGTAFNLVQSVEFHMAKAARRIARELIRIREAEAAAPEPAGGR
jgi:hypothetical protein